LEGGAKADDECVAKLHSNGGRGSGELGLVLFGKFQVDSGKADAMFQRLLLRFHLLDFAPNARDLFFDFEDVLHLAGARAENILEALLGFAGVFQPREKIGVLLVTSSPFCVSASTRRGLLIQRSQRQVAARECARMPEACVRRPEA